MTELKQLYSILQISEITPTLNNDKQQITTNDAYKISCHNLNKHFISDAALSLSQVYPSFSP